MFKENFIRICTQKGVAPSAVCIKIGLSNAAYSQWTEKSKPRKTTLLKLASELNVTVDELLGETTKNEEKAKVAFFRGAENLTPKQFKMVQNLIDQLNEEENGEATD